VTVLVYVTIIYAVLNAQFFAPEQKQPKYYQKPDKMMLIIIKEWGYLEQNIGANFDRKISNDLKYRDIYTVQHR
jgi:hypothetical protein